MHPDKKSLRAQCLAARLALAPDYVEAATKEFTQRLLYELPKAGVIAGYRSFRGEIDLHDALVHLNEVKGHTIALPVVTEPNAPMIFRRWIPGILLDTDRYGVEHPGHEHAEVIPDIIIAPLLAFDAKGHRLGYGGGYYDRTIAQLRAKKKKPIVIGAAYSIQQMESIIPERFDEKLDMVITEKNVIRF